MRLLLLGILLGVPWSRPARAEVFGYQASQAAVTYKVASNYFSATIRHPFRVVRLAGRNLRGGISFTPNDFEKGVSYLLELVVKDLDEPTGKLGVAVAKTLGAPSIRITGSTVSLVRAAKKPDETTYLVVRPKVELGPTVAYPEVRIRSSMDGRVLRWEFESKILLSDLGIERPTKWGIPSENTVWIEGEATFSPKD
jgi:hypothetical protein